MKEIVTTVQMKAAEANTINNIGIPSLLLMEQAAVSVKDMIMSSGQSCVLCVCGNGNNGADGFAIARMLYFSGVSVIVCEVGDGTNCSEENLTQKKILENLSIPIEKDIHKALEDPTVDCIVDAMFGIGLNRPLSEEYVEIINHMNEVCERHDITIIAVDIPSGLHADKGIPMPGAVIADTTVTFGYPKIGMLINEGSFYSGKIYAEDIGVKKNPSEPIYALERDDMKNYPKRNPLGHKGTFGKVTCIAGSSDMPGAALLCTKAVLKSGAGMVRLVSAPENKELLMHEFPEAMFASYESFSEAELSSYFEWSDVVAFGCGLTTKEYSVKLAEYVINMCEKPLLIDADGLNILAQHMDWLLNRKNKGLVTILTPHPMELKRLLGEVDEDIVIPDMELCKHFAKEYGVILVAKSAKTIITDGDTVYINESGTDALATAGSGDVLTGILAGVLAGCFVNSSMDILKMTAYGVFIHGLTGRYASNTMGDYCVTASDIITELPNVFKEITS